MKEKTKTPQQVLNQSREEFEKLPTLNLESFVAETGSEVRGMDNAKRLVDKDKIFSWHTSTLQSFLEAEIARLEGIVNYWEKDGQSFTKGVLSDLSDQITHLKELLVTLKK